MAQKEISIVLRAKNAMARGFAEAKETVAKFASSVANAGKIIATGFIAGSAALVAFATKALTAFAEQEKAEKALTAALNAHGEAGDNLLPMLKEVAARIQDQTGAADELTLATMATGSTLGVGVGQLEEYAKGVIALKSAGLEGATAARAMAAAMQGNTEMLTRYLPELRGVTDASEKQRIVNEFLERGYKQQQEELNTVSGRWRELKGRLGDAWEEAGRAIAQNNALSGIIAKVSEAVKRFTERLSNWAGSGGVSRLMAAVQVFFLDMKQRWEMASADAAVFFGLIRDTTAFKYLAGVAISQFNLIKAAVLYLKDLVVEAWQAIKTGGKDAFEAPDTGPMKQAAREAMEAIKGSNIETTRHYQDAIAARDKLEQDHAAQVKDLNKKITEKLKREFEEREAKAKAAAEAAANLANKQAQSEITADEMSAEERKKIADAFKKHREDLAKELEKLEGDQVKAVKDAEEEKRKEAEKTLDEAKRIAKLRVGDVVAMAKEEKRIAREVAKEDKKMQRLQNDVRRGLRLNDKQAAELAAWERIQAAKKLEAKLAQEAIEQAQFEKNQKEAIEIERKNKIEEIRKELGKDAIKLGDDEIENALNIKRHEEQIVKDRVAAFIAGNKARAKVDASNADEVIENMEGVASARDHLFPESISGSVGDNVSGAISAAEAFKQQQLNKLDEVIGAIDSQTEALLKNLTLSK